MKICELSDPCGRRHMCPYLLELQGRKELDHQRGVARRNDANFFVHRQKLHRKCFSIIVTRASITWTSNAVCHYTHSIWFGNAELHLNL